MGIIPALGRFTTMDPMAEKYYGWSPYVYVMNNPIRLIDPDGKDWISYKDNEGITRYEWRDDVFSQSELNESNSQATYLGITFEKDGIYFSLMGDVFNSDSFEVKIIKKMDEALLKHDEGKNAKYDSFGNLISGGEKSTNFDVGEYPRISALGLSEDTFYVFGTGEGFITYDKVDKGIPNNAKFGGFGDLKGKEGLKTARFHILSK